jgi:hypothetical protein
MKQFIFPVLLIFSVSSSSTKNLTTFDAYTCLKDATSQDAQILLNVIYWSYLRSETTLAAQEMIFEHFQQSWRVWLNSITTRRNPRTAIPYPEIKQLDATYVNLATQAQDMVQKTYLSALQFSIEENSLPISPAVKAYIEAARAEVRTQLAHTLVSSLVDVEKALQKLYTLMQHKNFIQDGIEYVVNGLALQSFAQFDKKYLTSSDQFFRMLAETQVMYSEVWEKLEGIRAHYYKNLYHTVYTTMTELHCAPESFLAAFDEHGYIPQEKQIEPLPAILL